MKTTHTPGPWQLRKFAHSGNNSTFVCDSTPDGLRGEFRGQLIASMTTAPETEANLRLISAAPDLLAALKAATWLVLKYRPMGSEDEASPVLSQAHAAIEKAEGNA